MRYMLLIYGDEAASARMSEAEREQRMAAWFTYTAEMEQAGVKLAGDALHPSTAATTVRGDATGTVTTDGPFAETTEVLGGFYMLEVPDLDAALHWAARCPGVSGGAVEVRPVWEIDWTQAPSA